MRPFRFGVTLTALDTLATWRRTCRTAERLGYDVVTVADHLGGQAPFSALTAAAAVTERVAVGTFVLNSALWHPLLLAREVATAIRLSDGRFELGVGTGYVRAEFERVGAPWGTGAERVARMEATLAEVLRLLGHPRELGDPGPPVRPPVVVGAHGDKALAVAARHADVVSFTAATLEPGSTRGTLRTATAAELDERVHRFAALAGERVDRIERNVLLQAVVPTDGADASDAAVTALHRRIPHLSRAEVAAAPGVLVGPAERMAECLRERRERFGVSSIGVLDHYMHEFAPVIALLAGT